MATTPDTVVLPITPYSSHGVATAAETSWHNPTNMVVVVPTADNPDGMDLYRVEGIARAALGGATNYALYRFTGSTYTLIKSVLASDNTPSASVANGVTDFGYSRYSPLTLKATFGLAFSIGRTVTNGVVCNAEGMKY